MTILAYLAFGALVCLLSVVLAIVVVYFRAPVRQLKGCYTYRPRASSPGSSHTIGLGSSNHVPLKDYPGHLVLALALHEDNLFFVHDGFNWPEIMRQLRSLGKRRGRLKGGSSITQQFAKNLTSDFERTYRILIVLRKIRDSIWSVAFERNFTKAEILELYGSSVRLGPEHPYGFARAAEVYFQSNIRDLTVYQSFFLVGIIPRPFQIVQRMLTRNDIGQFRSVRAYEKFVELFRLIIDSQGWGGLRDISALTSAQAVSILTNQGVYVPRAMPQEFEISLYIRSIAAYERVRQVLEGIMSAPPRSISLEAPRSSHLNH